MAVDKELHDRLDKICDQHIEAGHVIPVKVTGGRKFKGSGYLVDLFTYGDDYYSYSSPYAEGTLAAKIWDPVSKSIKYATFKFCELDESVSAEKTAADEIQLKNDIINETMSYCRGKLGSSAPLADVQQYAQRCLNKRYKRAFIDPWKMIQVDPEALKEKETAKAMSTIDFVLDQNLTQIRTENMIAKYLSRKRINYQDYRDMLEFKFALRGWTKFKRMRFDEEKAEDNVAEKSGL